MSGLHSEGHWEESLLDSVSAELRDVNGWAGKIRTQSIHLAVLAEPYLEYILDGSKTIESRFSVNRCAPYRQVERGDIVILKRLSGPVVAVCEVSYVNYYELDTNTVAEIRSLFTSALRADDPQFWTDREGAAYATLLRIRNVRRVGPIKCAKKDRRGWVIIRSRQHTLKLDWGQR